MEGITLLERKYIWKTTRSAYVSMLPTAGTLSKARLLHTHLCLRQVALNSSYCFLDRASEPAELLGWVLHPGCACSDYFGHFQQGFKPNSSYPLLLCCPGTSLCLFTEGHLSWAIAFFLSTSPCCLALNETKILMFLGVPAPRSAYKCLWIIAAQPCSCLRRENSAHCNEGNFSCVKAGFSAWYEKWNSMSIFKGLNSALHSYIVELPILAAKVTPLLAPLSSMITPTWEHSHSSLVSASSLLQLCLLSHLGLKYTSSSAFLVFLIISSEQLCSPFINGQETI